MILLSTVLQSSYTHKFDLHKPAHVILGMAGVPKRKGFQRAALNRKGRNEGKWQKQSCSSMGTA